MDNLNQLITSYNYSNIHNPSYSSWDVQIMSSSSNNNNNNSSNIYEENNNISITTSTTPTKSPYPDQLFYPNHHIGQEIVALLEKDDGEDQREDRKVVILDSQDRLDRRDRDRDGDDDDDDQDLGAMKEMMYKMAAMQPVDIDPATIRRPKRRNVRISEDPQSVAARHRRERISERIRVLQRLVPGGTKMDTASMLDEAIRYVKFLKRQIRILQQQSNNNNSNDNNNSSNNNYLCPLVGSGVINSNINMNNNNNNNNNNNSYRRLMLGTNYSSSESTWPGFSPAPNH